jgi:heme/copper-type cytochrome/quinol oxidase subunit 2
LLVGNRLNELQYIYEDMMNIQQDDFVNLLAKAEGELKLLANQTVELHTSTDSAIDDAQPYAIATFIIMLIAFIVMCVGFVLSIIAQSCAIKTQERKFKYLSNISWCTSSITLIMIFTAGLSIAFGGPVLADFCRI